MATLTFDILWKDRGATTGMTNLGKTTEKTGKSFKAMKVAGVAAIAAVGVGVAKFGKDSVKAYVEAEQSQLRLQEAFRKFPKLADTNIGSLNKLNSALALKTKYDDDATASGQAVLAQFNLTGKQITQLTPLLQDYAAKTGKDLPTAARDLGKATLGQGKALKNVGINFKDTGDKAKNLDQVTDGLRKQVGGFAEKEGKSAAGQAAILKNQFGELQETAGAQLLPALLKVGRGLLKVVEFGQGLAPMFKSFKTIAVATFDALTGSTGKGQSAFKRFSDFVNTHQADIIGGFVRAGKAVIKFAIGLSTGLAGGLRAFGALSDGVGTFVSFSIDQFGLMLAAAELSMGWMPGIGPKLKAAGDKFEGFANKARDGIHDTGNAARDAADALEGKLVPKLKDAERGLTKVGNAEIWKARQRDAAAKAAIAIRAIGTNADGSQIKLKKWADVSDLGAKRQRALRDRISDARRGLLEQRAAGIKAGDTQAELTKRWDKGKQALYREFLQMGLSKKEAQRLTDKYAKIPKKAETKVSAPGMKKTRDDVTGLDDDVNDLNNKSIAVRIKYNATGTVRLANGRQGGVTKSATGGVLPGWTPGRDVHRFTSQTAGDLHLSGGEGILIPQATKAFGGNAGIKNINDAARKGRPYTQAFADGGVVDSRAWRTASANERALARRAYVRQWGAFQTGDAAELSSSYRNRFRDRDKAQRFARSSGEVIKLGRFWYAFAALSKQLLAKPTPSKAPTTPKPGAPTTPRHPWDSASNEERIHAQHAWLAQFGSFNNGSIDDMKRSYRDRYKSEKLAERYAGKTGAAVRHAGDWYAFGPRQKFKPGSAFIAHGDIPPKQSLAAGGVFRNIRVGVDANNPPNVSGDYASAVAGARNSAESMALASARAQARAEVARQKKAIAAAKAAASAGSGSGPSVAAGPGWGPIMAAMRKHGARNFNTYPGHHPSMAMARDVTPHNWGAANAARALSSVWYVIYRMRIASKNHGNGWRQYHPISRTGDWTHNNHIHVARRRDQGGMLRPGQLAYNERGGDERVLTQRQNRNFERLVRVADRSGGNHGTHVTINVNAPHWIGDTNDLKRKLVHMAKSGDLDSVIRKVA